MEKEVVKLTKSQASLFKAWVDDYNRIFGVVQALCNDNLNLRLEKLASEVGVDIDSGNWNFDQSRMAFVNYIKDKEEEKGAEPSTSFPGEPEADNVDIPVGEPEASDAINTEEKEG